MVDHQDNFLGWMSLAPDGIHRRDQLIPTFFGIGTENNRNSPDSRRVGLILSKTFVLHKIACHDAPFL
jgi:hypothetical protein